MAFSDGSAIEVRKLNVSSSQDPVFRLAVRPPVAVILWRARHPTIDVCQQAFAALLAHPAFRPEFGVVSDWRRATAETAPHFDRDFLAALAKLQSDGSLRGRWASVVPARAQMVDLYRAGRTIEILGRPLGLRYDVFVNYDDAVTWVSDS